MKTQTTKTHSVPSLTHITLDTGHISSTSRGDVPESHIESMAGLIRSAKAERLSGTDTDFHQFKIPFDSRYTAMLSMDGTNLLTTLMHQSFGPVLTFGTALRPEDGAVLWSLLGGEGTQPPVPWCAVKFELGMLLAAQCIQKDVKWFGSFERDLAWGWHALAATTAMDATSNPAPGKCNIDAGPATASEVPTNIDLFSVRNNGGELVFTDYWATTQAKKGFCYLSGNAGVLRLLVPSAQDAALQEMETGTRVTIESSLVMPGRGFDIVFEDGTPVPYAMSLVHEQRDRALTPGRTRLVVYSQTYGKLRDYACRVDRSVKLKSEHRRNPWA